MTPRVTVVVASLPSTSRLTLESLDRQSLAAAEFDVVVVQDALDPRGLARMTQLADNRPNVRLHSAKAASNLGARRNAGFSVATGDYVLFLDSGVVLGDQALERLCSYADKHGADICLGKTSGKGRQPGTPSAFVTNRPQAQRGVELLEALDAKKIYRRSFLETSGLRFADAPEVFVDVAFDLDAISSTDAISVLADYPAFTGTRAWTIADAAAFIIAVATSTVGKEVHEQALLMAYRRTLVLFRNTMPQGLSIRGNKDLVAYRDAINAHVPRALDERLGIAHRALSSAIRAGRLDAVAHAAAGQGTRRWVRNVTADWRRGMLELRLDAGLISVDSGATARQQPELSMCVYRPSDGVEWRVPDDAVDVVADAASGGVQIAGLLQPDNLAGGEPLPDGRWIPAIRVVEDDFDRRIRIPFPRGSAGASHVGGRTTVSFSDAGKLALDVGAIARPVVLRLDPGHASVSEDARGSLLRVEVPRLDLQPNAALDGHLRLGGLPLRATIRVDDGRPVLRAWVSGAAGSYPLATKFSDSPFTPTGLSLEIDGVGKMTVEAAKRKPRASATNPPRRVETPARATSLTRHAPRLRRVIRRVPGAQGIYRQLRATIGG